MSDRGREWAPPAPADAARHHPRAAFAAGERHHHVANTAYPIAHRQTLSPYRCARDAHAEQVQAAFEGVDHLCLYAHVPFCEARCAYCEYTVLEREQLAQSGRYMALLRRELDLWRERLDTRRRTLHGFDIGGGTPSLVAAEDIAALVEQAKASFAFAPGVDISIETTPKVAAAEPAKLAAYLRAGIRRISLGIQVTQASLLSVLARAAQGAHLHQRAVDNIRAAGLRKLNVDLMYGFAGQSLEDWRATVEHALALAPEYVTLYRMRYKLTRLSHHAGRVRLGDVRAQAALAGELLEGAGYLARPGKNTFSRLEGDVGTSDYLRRRVVDGMPYLGVGLGAQSFTHTTLSYGEGAAGKALAPWVRSVEAGIPPLQDLYHLPLEHAAAKMVAVSLYFGEVDRAAFQAKFQRPFEDVYPREVAFALEEGLMEASPRAFSLTPHGARHFNGTIALFFAPSVQAWLLTAPSLDEAPPRQRRAPLPRQEPAVG
ncbi:MAG: radical SAM protein [Deltaproteobacteria bacterium]|nr:radical SAM protein [Deltaproteobacteria bacterium]